MTLRKGWAKAVARPWNDDLSDVALRLERGGHSFLKHVSAHLAELVDGSVFSPALYEFATRIWRRAGYTDQVHLDIMERSLDTLTELGPQPTWVDDSPDMDALAFIDRQAFEGFWQLGESGLSEAVKNPSFWLPIWKPVFWAALNGCALLVCWLEKKGALTLCSKQKPLNTIVSENSPWASRFTLVFFSIPPLAAFGICRAVGVGCPEWLTMQAGNITPMPSNSG